MNPALHWLETNATFCNTYDIVMLGLTVAVPVSATLLVLWFVDRALFGRKRR